MSFDFRETTALFGGSFHPPHRGHRIAIEGLFKNPGVKKVVILPSFGTPLKKVSVSFEHRIEMTKLAFQDLPETRISDFEFRHQTQYTWQVLEKFGPQVKNPAFVIGSDQFEKLDQWAKFPEFLGLCDWIVLVRKPSTLKTIEPEIDRLVSKHILKPSGNADEFVVMGKRMKFVETDAPELSSTWLREKLSMNDWKSAEAWIEPNVKSYILGNHVYGK